MISEIRVEKIATSNLPTEYGQAKVHIFKDRADLTEHIVLQFGEIKNDCLARVHSECFTGEVLKSIKCDCADQLDEAMEKISKEGGLIVYLRSHEGRGIGLGNKIKAYALQDEGLNTVEANHELGFPTDARSFEIAAQVFKVLGVSKVKLLTNNPEKIQSLEAGGVKVLERIPTRSKITKYNKAYLNIKSDQLGHLLS